LSPGAIGAIVKSNTVSCYAVRRNMTTADRADAFGQGRLYKIFESYGEARAWMDEHHAKGDGFYQVSSVFEFEIPEVDQALRSLNYKLFGYFGRWKYDPDRDVIFLDFKGDRSIEIGCLASGKPGLMAGDRPCGYFTSIDKVIEHLNENKSAHFFCIAMSKVDFNSDREWFQRERLDPNLQGFLHEITDFGRAIQRGDETTVEAIASYLKRLPSDRLSNAIDFLMVFDLAQEIQCDDRSVKYPSAVMAANGLWYKFLPTALAFLVAVLQGQHGATDRDIADRREQARKLIWAAYPNFRLKHNNANV